MQQRSCPTPALPFACWTIQSVGRAADFVGNCNGLVVADPRLTSVPCANTLSPRSEIEGLGGLLALPHIGTPGDFAVAPAEELLADEAWDIPRSGQNPKILGRDDTEVIRYLITIGVPSPGYFLAQEREDLRFEIGECRMTSIVGDMLVHQPP